MTTLHIYDDVRKALITAAGLPDPDAGDEARTGIRFDGSHAYAVDHQAVVRVPIDGARVDRPAILPAKALGQALKMAGKDDRVRIVFGDRQATVTVGDPTLPLDNPEEDEGLPPVAVELTYLSDDGWPHEMIARLEAGIYGQVGFESSHHIVAADRLALLAKLAGDTKVRIEAPADGSVWRVTSPWSCRPVGWVLVAQERASDEAGAA